MEASRARSDLISLKQKFFVNLLSFPELLIQSHGNVRNEIFINFTDILFHVKCVSLEFLGNFQIIRFNYLFILTFFFFWGFVCETV